MKDLCPCAPDIRSENNPLWQISQNLKHCKTCPRLCCASCMLTESVGFTCEQCRFDLTPVQADAQGYQCRRHCFVCPECSSHCSISRNAASVYSLNCSQCEWTSSNIGITATDAAGLLKAINARLQVDEAEYAKLKENLLQAIKPRRFVLDGKPDKEPGRLQKLLGDQRPEKTRAEKAENQQKANDELPVRSWLKVKFKEQCPDCLAVLGN